MYTGGLAVDGVSALGSAAASGAYYGAYGTYYLASGTGSLLYYFIKWLKLEIRKNCQKMNFDITNEMNDIQILFNSKLIKIL